jgi:pimeloyl-ACP methyl ester carboxylesterase
VIVVNQVKPLEQPRAIVVMQHGFLRSPEHLEGLAQACADRGMIVARPRLASLRPGRSLQSQSYVQSFARDICAFTASLAADTPRVVLGHSAGAAVVSAMLCEAPGMWSGAVLVDPVDRHGFIHRWAVHSDMPDAFDLQVLVAPPSACNRQGAAVTDLRSSGRLSAPGACVVFPATNHADIERVPQDLMPSSVRPVDRVVRWACGPGGDPVSVCVLGRTVVESIERLSSPDRG